MQGNSNITTLLCVFGNICGEFIAPSSVNGFVKIESCENLTSIPVHAFAKEQNITVSNFTLDNNIWKTHAVNFQLSIEPPRFYFQ